MPSRISSYSYATKQSEANNTLQYIFCSISLEINGFRTCPKVTPKTPYSNENHISKFNQKKTVDSIIKYSTKSAGLSHPKIKTETSGQEAISEKSLIRKSLVATPLNKKIKSKTIISEAAASDTPDENAPISSYMIYFGFDQSDLSRKNLITLEDWYPQFKNHKLQIIGFTDNVGPRIHNKALATSRAYKVRKFFLKKGFNFRSLNIIGKELCCYLEPNLTEIQRAKNRRVEIRIID